MKQCETLNAEIKRLTESLTVRDKKSAAQDNFAASLERRIRALEEDEKANTLVERCDRIEKGMEELKATVERMMEKLEDDLMSNINIVLQKQEHMETRLDDLDDERNAMMNPEFLQSQPLDPVAVGDDFFEEQKDIEEIIGPDQETKQATDNAQLEGEKRLEGENARQKGDENTTSHPEGGKVETKWSEPPVGDKAPFVVGPSKNTKLLPDLPT